MYAISINSSQMQSAVLWKPQWTAMMETLTVYFPYGQDSLKLQIFWD